MPLLIGIEGVEAGEVESVSVRSRTAAIRELRAGAKAVTAAGGEGALNVWRDDNGAFRCEFDRYRTPIDQKTFRFLGPVDDWLREWFPKLER